MERNKDDAAEMLRRAREDIEATLTRWRSGTDDATP
jgi:hypothetical protein